MPRTPTILSAAGLAALLLAAGLPAQDGDFLVVEKRSDLAARTRMVSLLHSVRVTLNLEDATPSDFVDYLQAVTAKKVNFILSKKAREDTTTVTLGLKNLPLDRVMAVYEQQSGLRFAFRGGLVFLKQKDEVKEFAYLRIYDVRAAVFKAPVFVGPKLGLRPPDGEGGFTGSTTGEPVSINGYDADQLVEMVKTHVVPATWDKEGISIDSLNGVLFVRQSVRGHAAVYAMLARLGAVPAPRKARSRTKRAAKRKKR